MPHATLKGNVEEATPMSTAIPILPPPLRDGDRLGREEFLRRWEAMPDLKRAELIDGVVYMPSPVGLKHNDFQFVLSNWLGGYVARTPGCRGGLEGTWLMGADVPQPDVTLRILPEYGGQSREERGYASGAPELAIEISASSGARDLGPKLKLYQRAQVREYITVLLDSEQVIWRELANGRYRPVAADTDGIFRSNLFPGLWLNTEALWRTDLPGLMSTLQKGLATDDHANFVHHLARQRELSTS